MPGQLLYNDVTIESAVITSVDVDRWTVELMTVNSSRRLTDVPWSLPYLHSDSGEGIQYVPEEGSVCLLLSPSDGEDSPVILAYMPVARQDTYRTNRIDMSPGDIGFVGRDGNRVMCRRGGILELSTGLATSMYFPISSLIRHFAKAVDTTTAAGDDLWEVDAYQNGSAKTRHRFHVRCDTSVQGEDQYDVSAIMGSPIGKEASPFVQLLTSLGLSVSGTEDDFLLQLLVGRHKLGQNRPVFAVGINKSGQVAVVIKDTGFTVEGSSKWKITELFEAEAKNLTLIAQDTLTTRCTNKVDTYTSSRETGTQKEVDVVDLKLGKSTPSGHQPLLKGPDFVSALANAFLVIQDTPAGPVPLGRIVPGPGWPALLSAMTTHTKAT